MKNEQRIPTDKLTDKLVPKPQKAGKMKTKPEDLTRWESEGGALVPTGALPTDFLPPQTPVPTPAPRRNR